MSVMELQRPPGRFRVEADMLFPLAQAASQFAKNPCVLFEVACTAGVPDIVLLELDRTAIAARRGTGPLIEPVDVRVMLGMCSVRAPMSRLWNLEELSSGAGVGVAHLRRTILPRMADLGHIAADGNKWFPTYRFRSFARRIVTIEAKLRDWRGGVAQASRHAAVADAAWVAVDARTAGTAVSHPDWFSMYGVGLASVSSNGEVEQLIKPAESHARQPDRELLAERAASLYLSGQVSGPLPKVFGHTLVASTGVDPRLVGAGAH